MPANFNREELVGFLSRCRIVTSDNRRGNFVAINDVHAIEPGRHYWLDPQVGVEGYVVALGYGGASMPGDYLRAIQRKRLNGLNSDEIRVLSALKGQLEHDGVDIR